MVLSCLKPVVNETNSIETVSRPILIFKHNPKAGGEAIKRMIKEFKPNKYNEKCNKNNNKDVSSTHILYSELDKLPQDIRNFGFVISNIREPCDHLLSLWSFGSEGLGSFRHINFKDNTELYGKDEPLFDSERDLNAFHNWLHDRRVKNVIATRFQVSYLSNEWTVKKGAKKKKAKRTGQVQYLNKNNHNGNKEGHRKKGAGKNKAKQTGQVQYLNMNKYNGNKEGHRKKDKFDSKMIIDTSNTPGNVDCWVYVDDFEKTLYSCLKEYENQGGFVDWTTPTLSKVVTSIQEELLREQQQNQDNGKNRKLKIDYADKGDANQNNQMLHHSKCSKYYDDESADFVRHGSSSFIYEMFGYDKCCGTRTNPKNKVILPPLPVQKMEEHNHNKKFITLNGMSNLQEEFGLSLTVFTILLFVPVLVKLFKKHYDAKRNSYRYDKVTSQEEGKL